jgi:DNA-binding MarR family transcriptional regulator
MSTATLPCAMTREPTTADSGSELSPDERIGYHLKRAEQALVTRKTELLRALELTLPQACVLTFLLPGAAKSCTHLAREALVTSQTMTGIVNNLEAKGFVARHPSPDHGRVSLISLTSSGEELARRSDRVMTDVEQGLLDAFSERERALLARLLDRAAEIAPATGEDRASSLT